MAVGNTGVENQKLLLAWHVLTYSMHSATLMLEHFMFDVPSRPCTSAEGGGSRAQTVGHQQRGAEVVAGEGFAVSDHGEASSTPAVSAPVETASESSCSLSLPSKGSS